MPQFEFQLRLSTQDYLRYYRGDARQVVVRSSTGATVQFPAALLQKFVTASGVQGRFVLRCDDQCKGAEISRVA